MPRPIMSWIVLPPRFWMPFPNSLRGIANALLCHCIPIALVARRYLAPLERGLA